MAHGLEVRQPLLDHRIVEFAASLPVNLKFRGRRGKLILQDTFGSMIPKSIFTRKKMGFGIPIANWFRDELKPMVHDTLLANDARINPYFRRESIAELVRAHETNEQKSWVPTLESSDSGKVAPRVDVERYTVKQHQP